MSKPIFLCDVDGVIADCQGTIHEFAQELLSRDLPPPSTWRSYEFHEGMGFSKYDAEYFYREVLTAFDPAEIRLYPGMYETVDELKELATVVFVTSPCKRHPEWMFARERLLECLDCEVIHTHSKHRVQGDYLLDDKASTIIKGGPWRGLLWDQPWNRNSPCPPPSERVKSWERVIEILKGHEQ